MSNTLGIKNKLFAKASMDDFFSSEEMRNGSAEEIVTVDISLLDDYKHHTFDIRPDDHPEMQELIHSIHLHGQITPGIVRPSPYVEGRYEIIKGHQTRHALEVNGAKTMKVIIRKLTDDEADIQMAETNIARPDISYMEKARTYKRAHDATVHQGKKADGMTNENLTRIFGDSARNINRYLRLNELNKDFQTLVDEGTISFNAAVELSYLSSEAQEIVFKSIDEKLLIYHHNDDSKKHFNDFSALYTVTFPYDENDVAGNPVSVQFESKGIASTFSGARPRTAVIPGALPAFAAAIFSQVACIIKPR